MQMMIEPTGLYIMGSTVVIIAVVVLAIYALRK